MSEYRIEVTGHMTVEADSIEEAHEKAEEKAYSRPMEIEHDQFIAHPLPPTDQEYFFSHINEVGSSASSTGYALMKDKSALNIAFRSSTSICRSLVGRNGASPLRYNLSAFLLATLEGYEWSELQNFVEEIKETARELPEDVDDRYSAIAGTEFVTEDRTDEIDERFCLSKGDEE